MDRKSHTLMWIGIGLMLASLALLVASFLPGWSGNADPAVIFLTLTAVCVFFLFAAPGDWRWKAWLYIPTGLVFAFGLIFLFNALTDDWSAWAYAWLLLFTGAGSGSALVARAFQFKRLVYDISLWTAAGSLILFGAFGAIAHGPFIRAFAFLLLALVGLLVVLWATGRLRWLNWPAAPMASAPGQAAPPAADLPQVAEQALVEPLSKRELEVLGFIEDGLSNADIAARLVVAQSTVKTHINNIYAKLGVESRTQAVRRARDLGLL